MAVALHWFLPTYGDSRDLIAGGHGSGMRGDRPADLRYLKQLAGAAEVNGFTSVLIPTGQWCEDAWLTASLLVDATESLKFLVAARPGLVSPTLTAQMAATLQWQSKGRLLLNVVTGGESSEQRAYGDFLTKDARYERTGEFLTVLDHLWTSSDPITLNGNHIRVENAAIPRRPDPAPPIFFGGSSAAAGAVAAAHADTYLTWGEPPADVAAKIDWIRGLAAPLGRTPTFGIRLHVIARETSALAWAEADRLLAALDPATVAAAQASLARSESEGQQRMRELHQGGADFASADGARSLEIYPNLWSGVGLVRGGAGTALVGSYDEVADRIAEYAALGLDHFILSGYPHLEEAYHVGEGVRPALARRGLLDDELTPDTGRTGTAFLSSLEPSGAS
ncbi:LLM class flavin-dependent oxidoreductase [Williamsia deligens]|uniref:LLM class flavin-dependent oxidoreductase n=1 Tax=Williamsia deligens TaxID=321325 RepID=A0ABW3G3M1_9NOCA|nr:LLM class flavin-dependent oxidoreductase [Williamsia deligens]MCP2194008.1 alkanesulfonate monooxygenase [Williamsia deligens]